MNDVIITAILIVLGLPVAVMAVWEIVEIWHHSSLLSTWRARVEIWQGRIGELLRCPFCLSPWVALVTCLILGLGVWLFASGCRWPGLLMQAPFYALAVARAANVLSDRHKAYDRTPKFDSLEDLGVSDDRQKPVLENPHGSESE